jgi:hypothetical protein
VKGKAAIIANPLASEDDIRELRNRDPAAAILHPNCPTELWWTLVAEHPLEAEQSVLFPLLTLEAPERWVILEERRRIFWINGVCDRLPIRKQHLFAAECLDRVLYLFEVSCLPEPRPRAAIEARRQYAQGLVTKGRWTAARDAARLLAKEFKPSTSRDEVATRLVAEATGEDVAKLAVLKAANAVRWSEKKLTGNSEEEAWQWRRLKEYLRGTVPCVR